MRGESSEHEMKDDARAAGGWTLIATLRHRPGRPTVVEIVQQGAGINADAWSRSAGWCEYCRTRRSRRVTYLLRHNDGRLAQIGSSCLAEFTGHPSPLRRLRPRGRRPGRRRPGVRSPSPAEYVEARDYLAHVAQAILDSRFTAAAAATRQRPATWSQALASLNRGDASTSRAQSRADEALHWVRRELAHSGRLDDFERRLIAVLGHDRLTRRELPTAAVAVYAYHRHLRRQIAARKKAQPQERVAG